MITQSNLLGFSPCPLCGLYDFVESNNAEILPSGSKVSADLYCSDCGITISGPTLEEAIRKWNKLGEKIEREGEHWVLADSFDTKLYKEYIAKLEIAHTALRKINRYNRCNNDLDTYLFQLAEWGMGDIEDKPSPSMFGLME